MFSLTGRVAVSGASSGLGYQMAKGFAGQRHVVIMARRLEKLEKM